MNRYFLLIACLQLWSDVTPVNPITTWFPLILALALTALKSAYDDINRYLSDRKANRKKCKVVRNGKLSDKVKSQDIQVGDIIKLEENDENWLRDKEMNKIDLSIETLILCLRNFNIKNERFKLVDLELSDKEISNLANLFYDNDVVPDLAYEEPEEFNDDMDMGYFEDYE
jgi:hypothetical protein